MCENNTSLTAGIRFGQLCRRAAQLRFSRYSHRCPGRHAAAEKARVFGDIDKALDGYERAMQGAREVGFTHDEALANELYARFWGNRGNDRLASLFMREAYSDDCQRDRVEQIVGDLDVQRHRELRSTARPPHTGRRRAVGVHHSS